MLAPPDHPAGRPGPRNNTTSTALATQHSYQIDTLSSSSSSSQPTANLHPNQQQQSQSTTHVQSPVIQYLLLPVDSSDDDSPPQEDQHIPSNEGRSAALPSAALAIYTQPFTQPSPLPSRRSTPTSTQSLLPHLQQHQQHQQQQHEYSIPESMGHESIGDFAYISTFPENDATSISYERQQQPYPDSFQQMQQVHHLNRAFSPQPSTPRQQQHQHQQQSNHHRHHSQQQHQYQQQYQPQHQHPASYPPPPIVQSRAYSEPIVHVYPEPELVDTSVNENNAAAVLSTSAGRSLSYRSCVSSSSQFLPIKPTIRKKNIILWIGGGVIITCIVAVIALVVVMKMEKMNDNYNDSDNTNNNNGNSQQPPPSATWPSRPTPTSTRGSPSPISGLQVSPPLLTSFPATNKPCPEFFCQDYLDTYQKTCSQDSAYRTCVAPCLIENGEQQQAFSKPILNSYPEPTLVDINDNIELVA
ncbi:hypothetical protein K457DRAFT_35998 [Linnemannia elongata AG-77]|uniref:Uncharacterized protein n=1 Tax=Linnemannia elongata AG-77 TaxID=1314771 RepID=A0A197JGK5_9FUNG|nr:hypothetical protein K457DRAFT_35998 [Linnemannia elongata AG-77]